MAYKTIPHEITTIVGNEPDFDLAAHRLRDVIARTVDPASWFDQGGKASVHPAYNAVTRKWYLVVYQEEATQTIIARLLQTIAT